MNNIYLQWNLKIYNDLVFCYTKTNQPEMLDDLINREIIEIYEDKDNVCKCCKKQSDTVIFLPIDEKVYYLCNACFTPIQSFHFLYHNIKKMQNHHEILKKI
jgi:hypothetical protein